MSITPPSVKNAKNIPHSGLTEREAKRKLQEHGLNILNEKKKISVLKILFEQFSDFMVLILIASTAISAFMGEMTEAFTIIAIVIVNAILGFIQEYKTERTLEALKSLAAPSARVIRGGRPCNIAAEQVVPGDLVILEAGDRIPADATLIEANNLHIDESLLTGESVPVEKNTGAVYMGTTITSGRAKGYVYATGMDTEMGKIAFMIQNVEEEETPLQRRLDHLGKLIVCGCLAICAVVTVTGILRGEPLFTMLLAGISLAVAAVPEGLPAIVTIALALGVQRMLKRNALIRKLPAVETLGCASVICSDKTGTLTENKMTVRKIYAGENIVDVEGNGYEPYGAFLLNGGKIDPQKSDTLRTALEIAGLCNNAKLLGDSGGNHGLTGKVKNIFSKRETMFSRRETWKINGDPTEAALLVAAYKAGITEETLGASYFRINEIPFDSDRKCMSVVCDNHKGETFVFTKGAPDVLIKKCSRIYSGKGITVLTPAMKAGIMKITDNMAEQALRVLATGYRRLDSRAFDRSRIENELIFVGLMGIIDPPRKEAADAVKKCMMAGIKPVMITGDHKTTACAVAKELGMLHGTEKVLTGAQIEEMGEKKLERIADDISVYARVSPKHKLMIVRALKKLGRVVAMTGDGVNDAPAVKEADIGVSMGISGTDVTKEASSMILMDDNFATIVAAVEEGRVIYNNIRKFIRYMLACNIGEVLTMFLGMLAGLPLPLLPIQILWVNLATDGLPAIALGLDPPEKDIMMRPPRNSGESIFSQGLANLIIFRGILIGLCTLGVFIFNLYSTHDINSARTAAFATLVLTQLIHVFECKSERKTIFRIPLFNNIALVLSVICSLAMILGVIYIPFLQVVFKTISLSFNDWLAITVFSMVGPLAASFCRPGRR